MNPHIRSQSPLCYPYTIPLDTLVIITAFADLSREKVKYFVQPLRARLWEPGLGPKTPREGRRQRSETVRAASFCCSLRFFRCLARMTLYRITRAA